MSHPPIPPDTMDVTQRSHPVYLQGEMSRENATSLEVPLTSVNGNPLPAISIDGPDDSRERSRRLSCSDSSLLLSPVSKIRRGDERRGRSASQGSDIWRHGDIKPENILRFIEGKDDAWIGTLKLADLGRAQKHSLMTQLRETREKEPWRTKWYEPPDLVEEVHERAQGKISRIRYLVYWLCYLRSIAVATIRLCFHTKVLGCKPSGDKRAICHSVLEEDGLWQV